jgi:hypothetical protein
MRTVHLELQTVDAGIVRDLLGDPEIIRIRTGMAAVGAPPGVELRLEGIQEFRAVGIPEILEFVLHFGDEVTISLIATWLYDRLTKRGHPQERVHTFRTRRREIIITPDGITRAIEEELEIQERE